jgi:hypothetical protein
MAEAEQRPSSECTVPKRIVFVDPVDRPVPHAHAEVAQIFTAIKNRNTAGMPAVFLVLHFRMDQKS